MTYYGGDHQTFWKVHDGNCSMGEYGSNLKEPILMLDISSPEVNRGSFCYLPYILYSGLADAGKDVTLLEDVTVAGIDADYVNQFNSVLCGLWSYPQIDTALMLNQMFPGRLQFFGYYPLIEAIGLRPAYYEDHLLLNGLMTYPNFLIGGTFNHILLSDCDAHLKRPGEADDFTVYPFFTSYGCPNGCTFCSATVNCRKIRQSLSVDTVLNVLATFSRHNITHIHFTDEDFFYNPKRALSILLQAYNLDNRFQFIALGECVNVTRFYKLLDDMPKSEPIVQSVLRLIEIGLETGDTELAQKMGGAKAASRDPVALAKRATSPILWLSMTFAPGETCRSVNRTGEFLKQYGLDPKQMSPRIRTNGTVGGLGQFFQFYHGCGRTWEDLWGEGDILTERPMRLMPSFLPDSWLDSPFTIDWKNCKLRLDEIMEWLKLYGMFTLPNAVQKVLSRVNGWRDREVFTPRMIIGEERRYVQKTQIAVTIALLQRLGLFMASEG